LFRLDSGLIVQQKNVVFNISKKSDFTVTKGILNIGHKRIKGSKIESRILVEKGAKLSCEGNFLMFYGADVEVFKGGHLRLKGNSGFNINCTIICSNSIIIGEYVAIGRNVTIRDNNGGHYISRQGYKDSRPVIIEDHAWLCEGCTIMPGVRIGTGAIVGAGSIVYTNVPPFTMVSGNPAKIVDKDIYWKA
ncbi:MAG: acyltransferase, partial [Prevotella sp.]